MFKRQGSLDLTAEPGADTFWIVDASFSYRLPKRYGIISVVGKNVFDQSFKYHDLDPWSPVIQPGSSFFIKFTLSI
jgi:outer membrane receptor protein involved in Fe transport